jgi:hypothetical protein
VALRATNATKIVKQAAFHVTGANISIAEMVLLALRS